MHLLRIGRIWTVAWGVLITVAALLFHRIAGGGQTPVVVFALSIASITYGGMLGAYLLAAGPAWIQSRHVLTAVGITLALMLAVFFAKGLALRPGLDWLAPAGRLAWPWYVPLGTTLTLVTGFSLAAITRKGSHNA